MTFKATIELHGKTATGVEVPAEVVEWLGAGRKPPVKVTINGHEYRSSVAVMGGRYMLGISAANRASAGVNAGDQVEVDLELDKEERTVTIPPDFADALARNAAAKKHFDSLSYSHRLQHVLPIEQAKTADTRQRRIVKAITMLQEGS